MPRGKTKDYETEIEKLKLENELLKQREISMPNDSLQDELRKIRTQSQVNTLGIPTKDITDHKNIYLYTPLNKKIGRLHPDNAVKTMMLFHDKGIQLYTSPRTEAQIEAYKKTDTYKRNYANHIKMRKRRREASGKGSFEKMSDSIAKQIGVAVKDLNRMPKKEDAPINV